MKIQMLKLARRNLERGTNNFICTALSKALHEMLQQTNLAGDVGGVHEQLRDHVDAEIDGRSTLEGWIIEQRPGVNEALIHHYGLAMRLAWIDKLIYDEEQKCAV